MVVLKMWTHKRLLDAVVKPTVPWSFGELTSGTYASSGSSWNSVSFMGSVSSVSSVGFVSSVNLEFSENPNHMIQKTHRTHGFHRTCRTQRTCRTLITRRTLMNKVSNSPFSCICLTCSPPKDTALTALAILTWKWYIPFSPHKLFHLCKMDGEIDLDIGSAHWTCRIT